MDKKALYDLIPAKKAKELAESVEFSENDRVRLDEHDAWSDHQVFMDCLMSHVEEGLT